MAERELYADAHLQILGGDGDVCAVFLKLSPKERDVNVAFALGRLCEALKANGVWVEAGEHNAATITFRASRDSETR